jgi:hypothetical protein
MTPPSALETVLDQAPHYPWLICEGDHRFTTAAYRFAAEMMPTDGVPTITTTTIDDGRAAVEQMLRSASPWVLIWSIRGEEILPVLDQMMVVAKHPNQVLRRCAFPIVACDRLGQVGKLALAEVGVSAFLRHPEDLKAFAAVIQAHFASSTGGLK